MTEMCGAVLNCVRPILHDDDHERADGVRWSWTTYTEMVRPPATVTLDDLWQAAHRSRSEFDAMARAYRDDR